MKPFEQGRFTALPDAPRRPHAYARTRAITLELDSAPFGRHAVHVREMGSGEPLLLIHGLMTTSYSWRWVFEPLAARFRVLAPDLVGCGRSDKPTDRAYSPKNLAQWIGELQRALGIRGCAIVGNSLGGHLARRLALEDPGAMRALVDIPSSPSSATARSTSRCRSWSARSRGSSRAIRSASRTRTCTTTTSRSNRWRRRASTRSPRPRRWRASFATSATRWRPRASATWSATSWGSAASSPCRSRSSTRASIRSSAPRPARACPRSSRAPG